MDSPSKRDVVISSMKLAQREAPKIAGSAAAFIIVAVILVLIIAVACTAVAFLLREEARESGQSSNSAWYIRISNALLSRRSPRNSRAEASRPSANRRSQGWIQAGREGNWDAEAANGGIPPMQQAGSVMVPMGTAHNTRTGTPKSTDGPFVYRMPPHTPSSDTALSMEDDPLAVRSFPYPDQYSGSSQGLAPSLQSHVYSPPSSPPKRTESPEPISVAPMMSSTNESTRSFSTHAGPMVRSFEGGSKFIEEL